MKGNLMYSPTWLYLYCYNFVFGSYWCARSSISNFIWLSLKTKSYVHEFVTTSYNWLISLWIANQKSKLWSILDFFQQFWPNSEFKRRISWRIMLHWFIIIHSLLVLARFDDSIKFILMLLYSIILYWCSIETS